MSRSCPFCGAAAEATVCGECGRDPTAPRRICKECGGWTPSGETICCACGAAVKTSLRWKIPLIVFIFAVAITLSILLR